MDKVYNITLAEFIKEYSCKYLKVEQNRLGVGEHELIDLGFSGGEQYYSSNTLYPVTSSGSSFGGVSGSVSNNSTGPFISPGNGFPINQNPNAGQINYHYGPITTESLNSLSEKAVKSMEDLERILIALDPIKGKTVFLLAHFLFEGPINNFTKAITFASEVVELEEIPVCEVLNTLLKDGYKGNFALLIKSARKLVEGEK